MTVLADLKAAYALIQDEARWCRGAFARDSFGMETTHQLVPSAGSTIYVRNPDAEKFCLMAAVDLVDERHAANAAARKAAVELFGCWHLDTINDRYGHRAALMVLRHAMLREEGLA